MNKAKQKFASILKVVLRAYLSYKKSEDNFVGLQIDKEPVWYVGYLSKSVGGIYAFYRRKQEEIRLLSFNIADKLSDSRILCEVIFHSRGLLVVLIVLLLITLMPYFYVRDFEISVELIKVLLGVYGAGATTILGIVFALYSVGFQTTTERFSSDVTDYLNREKVGQFFFKLLVFSSLFSIITLILQQGTGQPLILPFAISSFLFITSLVGILIFKDDYVTKLKPKQVFQRLYDQNFEAIRLINDFDNPNIKSFTLSNKTNIESFKVYLPIKKSWSIAMNLQKQVDDRLDINESLYSDLIRVGRISDATFGIVSLGYLLAKYSTVKHFIDKRWGWWFPIYQEVVTAESAEMFPIKANYEAMGIGRLGVKKRNYNWFEDSILAFFKKIEDQTNFQTDPMIGNALITAYEIAMAGHFVKTEKGLEKEWRGSFENQDFEIFEKTLNQFLSFGEKIAGVKECEGNFLNSLGQVKTVCVDGFSLRSFPGRLNDWKPAIEEKSLKLVENRKIGINKEDLISWKLPAYTYSLLLDYYEKIEVEFQVEGSVITPQLWLKDEILKKIGEKEKEIVSNYIRRLVEALNSLSKKQDSCYRDYSGGIVLGMFNQLISQNRWTELESLIKASSKELLIYFATVDHNKFLEQEYREPIDFGAFSSLVNRKKDVFVFYLSLFFMSQLHLFKNRKGEDTELLLKIARRQLMLGSLAYLVSELDQESFYVEKFTEEVERLYPQTNLSEIYGYAVEVTKKSSFGSTFRITYEEANRYRHFFRWVINSISDLPKDYASGGMSFRQTVEHPSEFIRNMTEFEFSDMDECFDGYVEWLKKREEAKKVTTSTIKENKYVQSKQKI